MRGGNGVKAKIQFLWRRRRARRAIYYLVGITPREARKRRGMEEAAKDLKDVLWCADAYSCMEGADALCILTEWNEFRALDLERVKALLNRPLMIDLRNIYKPADLAAAGFRYLSVGRAPVEPEDRQRGKKTGSRLSVVTGGKSDR